MFLIKIYIKESYINYYHTIIQMCGQYCILAPLKGCLGKNGNDRAVPGHDTIGKCVHV